MAIRLHLNSADVSNVRLAPSVAPLAETANAVRRLALSGAPVPIGVDAAKLAMVTDLVGYHGCRPSFALHPGPTLEAGLDQLLSTPRRVFVEDLEWVAESGHRPPAWTTGLVDGSSSTRRELAAAYRHLHRHLVQPYEPVFTARILHHQQVLSERLAAGGVHAVLSDLHPAVHWTTPVLRVSTTAPADLDVDLAGTGLLLEPAFFEDGVGVCHDDTTFGTVVTFALGASRHAIAEPPPSLVAVLGLTRARVLVYLQGHSGVGTGPLADGLGVSAASASEHVRVLREAGLVRSERRGQAVAHRITRLGWSLISASDTSTP